MKSKIASLVTLALISGFATAPASAEDASDLTGRAHAWMESYNQGALEDVAALYTEDGCRMLPNAGTVCGRDSILAALRQGMEQGIAKVKIETDESATSGDMSWGRGRFEIMGPNGETVDRGKWMNVSTLADGKWLIHRDTFNSDLPLPAAPVGATLVGVHEVEDGAKWLAAWSGENSRHELFKANGAASVRTFQSPDDPNLTGVVIQVTDMDALKAMLDSPEGQAAAAEDGVKWDTLKMLAEAD